MKVLETILFGSLHRPRTTEGMENIFPLPQEEVPLCQEIRHLVNVDSVRKLTLPLLVIAPVFGKEYDFRSRSEFTPSEDLPQSP